MVEWDIRITPSDQLPIAFDPLSEDFQVFVACEEGGTPDLKLHYHIYCISNRSETYLDKKLNQWGKATATAKGNAIFSKRKAHDGTIGYCVKGGKVVTRLGWTDQFLEEMLTRSRDYKKEFEKKRKQITRQKEQLLSSIMKEIAESLKDDLALTASQIMALVLGKYSKLNVRFPNRAVLETAVMTLLYTKRPNEVIAWYAKNLENNF